MSYTKKTDLVIYETTDYKKFKHVDENRAVSCTNLLCKAIKEKNKLKFNPIIVSSDFKVIDGQHRLHVAKELELPIYFVVDPDYDLQCIQKLNVGNKNWTQRDHISFFAKQGLPVYQCIQNNIRLQNISITSLVDACFFGKKQTIARSLKSGTLEFRDDIDEEKINKAVQLYLDVFEKFKYFSSKMRMNKFLQTCILKLILHPEYKHKRFIDSIDLYPDSLVKASQFNSMDEIKRIVYDEIYNRKRLEKNRLEY